MSEISPEEEAKRKKAIFDSMGARGQKQIMKKGYDKWDPFEAPKDPIDIRKDATQRTSQQLIREFLQSRETESYGNAYAGGALDICLGIINDNERYKGMYDFSGWYRNLLEKESKGKR